jgi:hypothetical protein
MGGTQGAGTGVARDARRDRHEAVIVQAEMRRLARELRLIGPMPATRLARCCRAEHWSAGGFTQAVREGVRQGSIRRLPFDYLASGRPGAGD